MVKAHQQKRIGICLSFFAASPSATHLAGCGGGRKTLEFQAVKPSYPLRKALIMLFRGELNVELKPKDESSWKEVFEWFKNTMPKLIDVLTNYKSEINKI